MQGDGGEEVYGRNFPHCWVTGSFSVCLLWVWAGIQSSSGPTTSGICQSICGTHTCTPNFLVYYLTLHILPLVTSICPLGILACPNSSRIFSELLPSSCELSHFQSWSKYFNFIAIWSFWGVLVSDRETEFWKDLLSHLQSFKGLRRSECKNSIPPSLCSWCPLSALWTHPSHSLSAQFPSRLVEMLPPGLVFAP